MMFGEKNNLPMDKACALLLGISPILQHYKSPFVVNAGIFVLILLAPYICLKLYAKSRGFKIYYLLIIMPLILFSLYKLLDHGSSYMEILHCGLIIIYYFGISNECINTKFFLKTCVCVLIFASVCLIFQYFCFYILKFHLRLVPIQYLLPESEQWVLGAKTGLIGINGKANGFYRPSAFFLEPSHFCIYAFPILCILLLAPDLDVKRFKAAIIISLGMFLSTSGMGVFICLGIWIIYICFYRSQNNRARLKNMFSPPNMVILFMGIGALSLVYYNVDFIQQSINRIFTTNASSTAISGRTNQGTALVLSLRGFRFLFGVTDSSSNIEFNLSGFAATMYKYGIVGIILSYFFYIKGLLVLKAQFFWISFIIVIISFFTAHTHGTFYMLYYVIILMEGYYENHIESLECSFFM